VDLYFSFVSAL
jgi:hypothetical protein